MYIFGLFEKERRFCRVNGKILLKIQNSNSFIIAKKGICFLKHNFLTLTPENDEKKLLHCGKFTFA